ncbi:MAG: hypothetical protein JF608_11700 [Sphingomonadales bacterium]|jgi:hypothetical protein|nr:hypothetical protein [Sphingomonadales bacterium]
MIVQYPSLYPVIAACIAQDRPPRPDELERVAQRIMREGSAGTPGARLDRRMAARAARTALIGAPKT